MLSIYVLRKFKEYIAGVFYIPIDDIHWTSSTMVSTDNFEIGVELINYEDLSYKKTGDSETCFRLELRLIFLTKTKEMQNYLPNMFVDAIIKDCDVIYQTEEANITIVRFRRERLNTEELTLNSFYLGSYECTLEYRAK